MEQVYIHNESNDEIWLSGGGLKKYILFPFIKFSTY
jgi:hypothetical protein